MTKPKRKIAKYDETIDLLADAFLAVLAKGIPFSKIHNIPLRKLDEYYRTAYNLYRSEKYERAKDIFSFITFHNYMDKKSWMGLAGCCQMLKQYPQAISTYNHVKLMDPADPLPLFHSFTCFVELKKYPEALAALEAVILRSLNKPEYAELKQQAEAMKKALCSVKK